MALVLLEDVTYTYPLEKEPALKGIDLAVDEGEFVGIVGANGAGKSTLCHVIAGFVPHFFKGDLQGRVQVAGRDVPASTLGQIVKDVGLVFQNPFTQISGARFTVYEELAFGLENLGFSHREMQQRLSWVMDLTNIEPLRDRSPYALSGGQQQRVALASILVMRPSVLVLDEPTSQLDPAGSREIYQIVDRLRREGMTVVLVSHAVEWMATYADRVIALAKGEIVLQGPPRQVLTSPLLLQHGIGASSYTRVARAAREADLWPAEMPLPVTLEQAVEGFSRPPGTDDAH
jgi:energy-coupling factor transporter ATP-binding protein EcfA2